MNSKERMLIAIKNEKPDQIPVAPDISCMIPCKLTKKPFWDIGLYHNPPLWKAYLDALAYFKFDGWFVYGMNGIVFEERHPVRWSKEEKKENDRIIVNYSAETPAGPLDYEETHYCDNPPALTRKLIKDLDKDFPKLQCLYAPPLSCNGEGLEQMRKELGDAGVLGVGIFYPGFSEWTSYFEGSLESVTYAYYDNRDKLHELYELQHKRTLKMAEMILELKPDFILTGSSGTLTLGSPALFREFGLKTLKAITSLAKQAGIPTMLHSCGKERALVEICANETDLNCINPLEIPNMGDCNLAEIKKTFGKKLSLMGNLHTTEVMLRGTPEDVERAAKQAIDDAGQGGGFILSTGDQCGTNTPDENIFKMIDVARTYGRY